MKKIGWLLIGSLLAIFPILMAQAGTVSVEIEALEAPEEEIRQALLRAATEKLVAESMKGRNLNEATYQEALDKKFVPWFVEIEKRLREELTQKNIPADQIEKKLSWEKTKSRFSYAKLDKLIKSYTIKSFAAHPETVGVWQMTLEGEVDENLLPIHVQRMQDESRAFRRLWIYPQIRLDNFSWEDLKLSKASDFMTPVQNEWLKWFQDRPPGDVEDIAICDEACEKLLEKWRAHDDKNMGSFVEPELIGGLLLTVNINLSREQLMGAVKESKITYSGGLILQDLNTKRVLHWADLPKEIQTLKLKEQKKFNSGLATQTYRYPLSKFEEAKNQVGKSVSLTNSVVLRLVNARHLGEAMRLVEWIRVKGAPMQAQGKLDSFNSKNARILVHFRGEGNKFKALVSGVKELESEWGRPLVIEEQGNELIITLESKP
jgi:hypothetical protein